MSKAEPYANSTSAGTGQTWFKIFEIPPVMQNGQLTFPSESTSSVCACGPISDPSTLLDVQSFTFTIPKSLPSGQYLIRVEHVSLTLADYNVAS